MDSFIVFCSLLGGMFPFVRILELNKGHHPKKQIPISGCNYSYRFLESITNTTTTATTTKNCQEVTSLLIRVLSLLRSNARLPCRSWVLRPSLGDFSNHPGIRLLFFLFPRTRLQVSSSFGHLIHIVKAQKSS